MNNIDPKSPVTFYVYELWFDTEHEDWSTGEMIMKPTSILVDRFVVNDSSDNLCIGSVSADGNYHQYDSYEAYHAESYYAEYYDDWKLRITSRKVCATI